MPEIRFQVQWPDGDQETCYSPSLVVKDYFEVGKQYALEDFTQRSREAFTIASDRVQAKFGYPCGLAIGQLESILAKAQACEDLESPMVEVLRWLP